MVAGMLTAFFFDDIVVIIAMAILAPAMVFLMVKRNRFCICAISAIIGIVTMFVWIKSVALPIARFSGKTVTTEIEVIDVVSRRGGERLLVSRGKPGEIDVVMGLTCYERLEEGQRVIAKITVTEPIKSSTAFNLSNGILLEGEIVDFTIVSSGGRRVSRAIKSLREGLFNNLLSCGSGDSRMLMQSMLLGMDSELSTSLEDNMRVCGVSHYTAVSGAHFAILSAVLLEMMSDNRRRAKSVFSMALALAGILFFGPTKSVLRASTMFFIGGLAGLFRRKADTLNSLCVSIILITMFRPQSILDVGFAMSVTGVFGAGVVGPRLADRFTADIPKRAKLARLPVRAITISASAMLCTAPISAAVFGGVSALGAVVTLIIAPLITLAMASMLIAAVTGLWIFTVPMEWSMRIAAAVIRFFGKWRWLYINTDSVGSWVFPLACAVLISVAALGGIKMMKPMLRCSVLSVICLLILSQEMILNRCEIRFVGNSTTSAAIVMRGSSAIVYISGGGGLSDKLSQCLRMYGVMNIVCVVAVDVDYIGALDIRELSEMVNIDTIYSNEMTAKLLPELPVVVDPSAETLSVSGLTIGSARISDTAPDADIVLVRGSTLNPPPTSAQLAVYCLPEGAEIPENGINILTDRDFKVDLRSFIGLM